MLSWVVRQTNRVVVNFWQKEENHLEKYMFGKNSARINIAVRNTIQRLEPITLNSQSCSQTQKQSDTVHSEEHNSHRGTKSLHNIRSCRSIMRPIENTEVPHSLIQNLSQVQQWKKKNPVSHSCYQIHPNIALDGQVKKKKRHSACRK